MMTNGQATILLLSLTLAIGGKSEVTGNTFSHRENFKWYHLYLDILYFLRGSSRMSSNFHFHFFKLWSWGKFSVFEGCRDIRGSVSPSERNKRSLNQVRESSQSFPTFYIYLHQFRLCGNQLVNMLSIICRVYALSNRGNHSPLTTPSLNHPTSLSPAGTEKYHGGRSFSFSDLEMKNSVRHKRGISGTTRRHRVRVRGSPGLAGGLATTCCQSSCSVDQLMAAC